jgi:hypothetical protein
MLSPGIGWVAQTLPTSQGLPGQKSLRKTKIFLEVALATDIFIALAVLAGFVNRCRGVSYD